MTRTAGKKRGWPDMQGLCGLEVDWGTGGLVDLYDGEKQMLEHHKQNEQS